MNRCRHLAGIWMTGMSENSQQHARVPVQADSAAPKFRRRAEARPDEILDAALMLFVEKGYTQTRVDDVARLAGLSKGGVYLYFPSKDALLEGLVRRAVSPLAAQALEMMAGATGDPRPIVRAILTLATNALADDRTIAIPKLVIREAVTVPRIAEIYRAEILDRMLAALTGLFQQAVDAGHIRPVDPALTVRSLLGPILMHLLLAEFFGIDDTAGKDIPALLDNHLTILFAGLAPEEAPHV